MAAPAHSIPVNTSAEGLPSATDGTARRRRQATTPLDRQGPADGRKSGHLRQISRDSHQLRRKKPRSLLRRLKRRAIKHTWSIPLLLLVAFASLYAINPTESNVIHHFIFLSYKLPTETGARPQYGKGLWDIAFVAFYTVLLSFTREFIMQEILRPLARASSIKSNGKRLRFMEQMYTAIYFGIAGPAGLYVMRQTPVWYFNTKAMYEAFPHRTHFAEFKCYYLIQAAYWAQQAIVMLLGMEKPRKDFKELVAHHIVTLALIGLSYRFHFTYMGIAVYITHDLSDLSLAVRFPLPSFLPSVRPSAHCQPSSPIPPLTPSSERDFQISKSFHYLDSDLIAPFYALSVVSWIYLRHYLNLGILYSLLTEFRTVGPYELNWETQQYKCWISNIITFALLAMLQSLNLFWLYCLLRSAWKFVAYGVKKDDRSDDESEVEEQAAREKTGRQ
ncbi:hypothetical protein N7462_006427 [Penicillium macrosclerotiorum]|uniref:uncharacterized protein n=1 Tax=Penicillium macrosclerotiorum TaxID=303699 RepID=UPI0025476104|nr:uncharacterized protein N7462_006427 [Penicillium macrosclerotiorum]KAJ5683262.1 hypothetical protein N7462_006427 [Penicillium macrosclerotiorum]